MPLARFEVRNEYSLGQSQLYKEGGTGTNREDPKAILDGVAVAGLVGILRQLGDLAEFAAEVFHGLQEQVMSTASRSHKLMVRVQNIETSLPSLEKAVLAQTSHVHFAYTAGSEWHSRIQNGQNHFIYNDLPRFIMDSYEECRDPPRLHLLDKFDTGGPGSCLKRYSDPTFFRRASGSFRETDAEKIPIKEKKARKSKKKRSSQRNVDFLRSASMPNQSSRLPSTTPIVNGRSSPSHTASTIDMTLKSDLGYYSNSFDSRTGSAFVECIFHMNSSAQTEEHESKELSSRFMHHNDIADSVIPDRQSSITTDNFHQSSSPEPVAPGSSCDTWDEKAETMEPKVVQFDENEASEMFTRDSDLGIRNGEIIDLRSPDQMDKAFDQSSTSKNELDDVESEPDNYVDALNTIESESEIDPDCQMKHEVKQFSPNIDKVTEHMPEDPSENDSCIAFDLSLNKETPPELPISVPSISFSNERTSHTSKDPCNSDNLPGITSLTGDDAVDGPSENDSCIAFDLSLNEETPPELPISVPSISFSNECTSHTSKDPCNSDNLPGITSLTGDDAVDGLKVESFVNDSDPSSSVCGMSSIVEPLNDKAASNSCKSQESQAELASVQPVSFWTNGGLLGLEPSKPPDFAVANASSKDSGTTNGEVLGPLNHVSMPSNDGERGRSGRLVKDDRSMDRALNSECSSSQLDSQAAEVEKTGDSHHNSRFCHADGQGRKIIDVKPGKELDTNVNGTCIQEYEENSSQMFGLGHRLLINGFRRKMLLVPGSESELARSLKTGTSDQRDGQHNIAYHAVLDKTYNGKLGHKTTLGSLTSSPPLEHMKISFHPIDGFEASRLNLKFPDGNHSNGNIRDMFPAFQLVPESSVSLKGAGSDSDDDTFCRSSPYISDDGLSNHSDSDSEQWESDESPENKDHDLYDDLCRTSPVEIDTGSLQHTEMGHDGINISSGLKTLHIENGVDSSLSSSMLDLPSFDAVSPVIWEKSKDNLESRNLIDLQYPKDPNPSPPPPPPVQWWATKTTSYVAKDKHNTESEADAHEVDKKLLEFTVTQQHKPAPANGQQTDEVAFAAEPMSKQQDQWKLNTKKEAHLPANAKGMEEKEDFLQQIREKSFTLRRTVTPKPTFASVPAASDKVTAILEKAIAIRQAVGSDEGEDDDTWSDT